jgi:tRNA(fMet)-specific endonuclease VapC
VIVLDTDVLTIIQRESGEEYERLAARIDAVESEPVAITVISYEEQFRGWLAAIAAAKTLDKQIYGYGRLQALVDNYQEWECLPFDNPAAEVYTRLKKSKVRIGTMDLKLASIALSRDALLVSRNLRDFQQVPDLRAEDWTLP